VILINLLPHREAARKRKREMFFISLAIAALIGGLISGATYSWYLAQIEVQQGRNKFLQTEIERIDQQIKSIAALQSEISALKARQTSVENLQGDRNLPVYLLSELVKQLPDGVYINSIKQENQVVLMTGIAQSNERVAELLRNLGDSERSPWLRKPELVEITASTVKLTARDQRRVSIFSMRTEIRRLSDEKASAASAPASSPASSAAKI
jgi:type IV pilus assembly protein PilN